MMNNSILTEIKNHKTRGNEESEFKNRFINFIENHYDCFERSNEFGHLTASAFIIDPHKNKILLLHHKKLNKWLQPGGHCDGDKNIFEVAKKEVWEETGLKILETTGKIFDLDIHTIPEHKGVKEHYHFDVRYLFKQNSENKLTINNESNQLAWINAHDLEQFSDEISMIRMRNKAFGSM